MKRSMALFSLLLLLPLSLLLSVTPVRAQKGDPDDGKDVYKKKCQSCHGPNGDKTTYKDETFPALTANEIQAESDADLGKQSVVGKTGKMGKVSGLSAEDVADVVAYVRTLKQ